MTTDRQSERALPELAELAAVETPAEMADGRFNQINLVRKDKFDFEMARKE
jgi:hypothetical protein